MTTAQSFLFLLVLLCALAIALRVVSRRAAIPYPVVLAAGGILVGLIPGLPHGPVNADLILLVFVPGLVFHAARTLELDALRQTLLPVALLATIGVVASVAGVGAVAHVALGLSWPDALLLGSILAPTDPIAVVALVRGSHAPGRIAALLEGESLVNDGTGIAVFAAVLASIGAGTPTLWDAAGRFFGATAGGTGIGIAAGAVGVLALRTVTEAQVEILVTLTLAYGAYFAADVLGVSGVVAVVAAGLTVAGAARRVRLHGRELDDFWEVLAFVLNALLFLLIGTALPIHEVAGVSLEVALVFATTVVARALTVDGILAAVDPRARRVPWRWRHLCVLAGMRGALSVALALSVAADHAIPASISTTAYGAVILSVLLQGGLLRPASRLVRRGGRTARHRSPGALPEARGPRPPG